MAEQAVANHRQLGKAGDGEIRKALHNVGVVPHNRPLDSLETGAHEEVDTQTEGSQRQTGDILIGLQGNSEERE